MPASRASCSSLPRNAGANASVERQQAGHVAVDAGTHHANEPARTQRRSLACPLLIEEGEQLLQIDVGRLASTADSISTCPCSHQGYCASSKAVITVAGARVDTRTTLFGRPLRIALAWPPAPCEVSSRTMSSPCADHASPTGTSIAELGKVTRATAVSARARTAATSCGTPLSVGSGSCRHPMSVSGPCGGGNVPSCQCDPRGSRQTRIDVVLTARALQGAA